MGREQDRIANTIRDLNRGNTEGRSLRFNPYTKRIEESGPFTDPDRGLHYTTDDTKHAITKLQNKGGLT